MFAGKDMSQKLTTDYENSNKKIQIILQAAKKVLL
jgi:hypothetical protein